MHLSRSMKRKRQRPGGKPKDEPDRQLDLPPLGPDGQRAEPLEGPRPQMARRYDPGFKPPDADADPWQDEGEPETNG